MEFAGVLRGTKHAEADLLVKLAEAKRTQLRNDAFQGAGSDRMVGLKMAEVYKGLGLVDDIKRDLSSTLLRTGRDSLSEIVGADAATLTAEDWPVR